MINNNLKDSSYQILKKGYYYEFEEMFTQGCKRITNLVFERVPNYPQVFKSNYMKNFHIVVPLMTAVADDQIFGPTLEMIQNASDQKLQEICHIELFSIIMCIANARYSFPDASCIDNIYCHLYMFFGDDEVIIDWVLEEVDRLIRKINKELLYQKIIQPNLHSEASTEVEYQLIKE